MPIRRRRSIFEIINEYFENLEDWTERPREALIEKPSWDIRACTIEPLRNLMVTPTEVTVTVDLPYAEENTIRIKPMGRDGIQIIAKMKQKIRFDDFGITHYKGEFQTLKCQTRVPVPVDLDKMEMRFKKGILEIRLPRKHEYDIPIE